MPFGGSQRVGGAMSASAPPQGPQPWRPGGGNYDLGINWGNKANQSGVGTMGPENLQYKQFQALSPGDQEYWRNDFNTRHGGGWGVPGTPPATPNPPAGQQPAGQSPLLQALQSGGASRTFNMGPESLGWQKNSGYGGAPMGADNWRDSGLYSGAAAGNAANFQLGQAMNQPQYNPAAGYSGPVMDQYSPEVQQMGQQRLAGDLAFNQSVRGNIPSWWKSEDQLMWGGHRKPFGIS